jgi:hypothetical protein
MSRQRAPIAAACREDGRFFRAARAPAAHARRRRLFISTV